MTSLTGRLGAPRTWRRLPRRTARLRLTLLYGSLFTVCGAALLGFTFWLFYRATAGKRLVPLGTGYGHVVVPRGRSSLPPAACRHVHPNLLAQCVEGLGEARAHAFDLHVLLEQSGIALAVMAAFAFALGWLVAGRVLRPLRAITGTAQRISATSLHERLALAGPDDEFKELADTLDGLFARLEASFSAQRNFVASAAHELRTPLTLDKTLLQVALRNPRSTAEQWRATGADLLESGLQQERILEALLTLATSEAGLGRHEPADLAKVAAACLESAGAEAGRRGLHVETSLSPAPMLGDPDLVTRLVANLVDNAVRHNVPGGTVEVGTAQRDGQAVLTVANDGLVIPPGEIGRLMQPFQRLAATRSSGGDGHGLGLPIVCAIATAHGATLTTRARPEGGLQVEVSFPPGASISRREPQAAERPGPPLRPEPGNWGCGPDRVGAGVVGL
jgi:signal transduction histidine kinase